MFTIKTSGMLYYPEHTKNSQNSVMLNQTIQYKRLGKRLIETLPKKRYRWQINMDLISLLITETQIKTITDTSIKMTLKIDNTKC